MTIAGSVTSPQAWTGCAGPVPEQPDGAGIKSEGWCPVRGRHQLPPYSRLLHRNTAGRIVTLSAGVVARPKLHLGNSERSSHTLRCNRNLQIGLGLAFAPDSPFPLCHDYDCSLPFIDQLRGEKTGDPGGQRLPAGLRQTKEQQAFVHAGLVLAASEKFRSCMIRNRLSACAAAQTSSSGRPVRRSDSTVSTSWSRLSRIGTKA